MRATISRGSLAAMGVLCLSSAGATTAMASEEAACRILPDERVVRDELGGVEPAGEPTLLLRFAQISDEHIMDEDGALVNGGSPLDPIEPTFASAQRMQDEYTDEVLNSMIGTINACHEESPLELVVCTGDNTDLGTVAEVRRFITNMDGELDRMSAFEQNCRDELPAGTPEGLLDLLCTRFTGRTTPDSQSTDPDPGDPTYQVPLLRTVRQILDTEIAVLTGRASDGSTDPARQTLLRAAGLPALLRCAEGAEGCGNRALDVPYYVAFGNHDAYVRGTLVTEPGVQEVSLAPGRHYMKEQHEFIQEFFETAPLPGPVGHGFGEVEPARFADGDRRNDGYYAFDAGSGGAVRMIVLNSVVDGVDQGVTAIVPSVGPLDVRNPAALESGSIDREQFEWLRAELDAAEAAEQLVLVFSHHPDVSFAEYSTLAVLAAVEVTAAELDAELASHPNVVAWVAGHTHRNRVRAFRVEDGVGTNGTVTAPVDCPEGKTCPGFWQVETASLIDHPQEARLLELLAYPNGTGVLRATVVSHGFERSKALAAADDQCQFYPTEDVQQVITDADLTAICTEGGSRVGDPHDRNVDLRFSLP